MKTDNAGKAATQFIKQLAQHEGNNSLMETTLIIKNINQTLKLRQKI
jgi:hypothetical protein